MTSGNSAPESSDVSVEEPSTQHRSDPTRGIARRLSDTAIAGAVPFLAVLCFLAYFGQEHRAQSGNTYATVMTAVAIVQKRTIWLEGYLPYIQARSGEHPYMVVEGQDGRPVNMTPLLPSVYALPTVLALDLVGTDAGDWSTWMEAGMFTAAITATLSVLLLFVLATRLTTRPRAFLVACVYALGTPVWGIAGQALWQHGPVLLALTLALLALHDRRLVLAGAAGAAMIATRPSTVIFALLLLPLVGRSWRNWGHLVLGAVPFGVALATYNAYVFGSPLTTGYTRAGAADSSTANLFGGDLLQGLGGLLVSPGRGLLVYSPVLAFALLGAVKGFRVPLYRWSALAALAYFLAMGFFYDWSGGEAFGPRMIVDTLPLLAILLVPALDVVVARPWLRWVFGVAVGWSVAVQVLGAAAWTTAWYDTHDATDLSVWWSFTSNELVSILQRPDLAQRMAQLALTLAGALVLAFIAAWLARPRPRPSAP